MSTKTPAEQTEARTLLTNMRDNGALNEGEYRALLGALRADLVEAVWAARTLEREELERDGKVLGKLAQASGPGYLARIWQEANGEDGACAHSLCSWPAPRENHLRAFLAALSREVEV